MCAPGNERRKKAVLLDSDAYARGSQVDPCSRINLESLHIVRRAIAEDGRDNPPDIRMPLIEMMARALAPQSSRIDGPHVPETTPPLVFDKIQTEHDILRSSYLYVT